MFDTTTSVMVLEPCRVGIAHSFPAMAARALSSNRGQ